MAKVKKYSDGRESTTSVWNNSGDKRYGFVSKDRAYNDNAKTRYGVGIDNVGSPYRGALDREINTPLGKIDYGYDGDTVYGGITPNIYGGTHSGDLPLGGTHSGFWAGIGDYQLRGNNFNLPGETPSYSVGLNFPDNTNIPNYYNEVNTPLGTVYGGTNDGNPNVNVGFQPNEKTNYYLQALANLLRR